jgi:hypothetical protein
MASRGYWQFPAIVGTPPAVTEGATATKGFVDYYNTVIPDFTFGNTLFHVTHENHGD